MKNKTPAALGLLLMAAALNGATLLAHAQDATATTSDMSTETTPMAAPLAAPDKDPWRFSASIPLWAPAVDGNVTVLGHEQNVDVSFSTLRDHLDTSLGLALSAQKGKFGFLTSVGYMKFSAGNSAATAGLKFLMYNAAGSYVLVKEGENHPFVLAGTAGLRYWYASSWLTIPAFAFHGSETFNLVDPVIGLRASQFITRKLHVDLSGDVGGFDINHDTDFTWSAAGMVTYDFTRWLNISAGYQAVALDELNGTGPTRNGVDLLFNGVAGAITIRF